MPIARCGCGAKYRFPDAAVGKKARCKKCNTVFVVKQQRDAAVASAASDPHGSEAGGLLNELTAAAERSRTAAAEPGENDLRFQVPAAAAGSAVSLESPSASPKPGYQRDLLWTLVFPADLGNLITFIAIWIGYFIGAKLPFVGILVVGWYYAYRFEVITSAASGEQDIPSAVSLGDGLWESIFYPLFAWIGSWLIVWLPAIVYIATVGGSVWQILGATGGLAEMLSGSGDPHGTITASLVMLGMFIWPMTVLCIAIGGFSSLLRLDLIALTIVRTLPVYVLTVAVVFGAEFGGSYAMELAGERIVARSGGGIGALLTTALLANFLAVGVMVYIHIVAGRAIGLYYHHFKHRFAWDWG